MVDQFIITLWPTVRQSCVQSFQNNRCRDTGKHGVSGADSARTQQAGGKAAGAGPLGDQLIQHVALSASAGLVMLIAAKVNSSLQVR